MRIGWRMLLGVLVAAGLGQPVWAAGPLTLRYFQELRARRLYSLVEQECAHQLSRPRLSPTDRADLTVELASTLVEHASYVSDREQQEMWLRARDVLKDLLNKDPDNPRAILLEANLALIPAAEANWCRWQAELIPYDGAWSEQARKAIDEALPRLQEVEKRLTTILRTGRKDLPAEFPKPFELRSLLANVSFRRAQTQLDAALLPNATPADRSAALIQAERLLRPLAEGNDGDPVTWSGRVLYVQCLRLMGESARALRTVVGYESATVPPDYVDSLEAERIRLLQIEQPKQASRELDAALNKQSTLTSELAFVKTQQLAEAVRDAIRQKSPDLTARHVELQDFVERTQNEVGGYWSYRCALVQHQIEDELKYGIEVAPLVRRAESEFRRGKTDAALASYKEAVTKSEEAGKGPQAFDLGYIRASIAVNAKRWADAVDELYHILELQPQHRQASDAHLLRAYALGRLYEEKPTQARREDFTESLEKIRELYPKLPAFGEATWMLADLEDRRNQVTVALQLFGEVPVGHPRYVAAQLRMAQCYPRILDRLRELKRPAAAWEAEAQSKITAMLPADLEAVLDEPQIETALILAHILSGKTEPDQKAAGQWLARVFRSLAATAASPPDPPVSSRMQVASLAAFRKFRDAAALLPQVAGALDLIWLLETLGSVTSQASELARGDMIQLQMQVVQQLLPKRSSLPPSQQRRADEAIARTYLAAGQSHRALALFPDPAKAAPDDRSLLKGLGELLQDDGSEERLSKALIVWEKLAGLETEGTIAWLQARLQVGRCLVALGKKAECRTLLAETQKVSPEWGNPDLAQKFSELTARAK